MNILLLILSVVPSFILLVYCKSRTIYTKQPVSLIIRFLCFGMLSVLPTIYFETVFDNVLIIHYANYPTVYTFISTFFGVALIEEGMKFLVLDLITKKHPQYLKCIYDGLFFSVSTALGFAVLEHLLYVFIYYGGSFETAILRAATPGHFFFSIIMGLLYSESKKYDYINIIKSITYKTLAIVIPTILHGLYDFCLSFNNFFLNCCFIVLLIALYIYSFLIMKKRIGSSEFI